MKYSVTFEIVRHVELPAEGATPEQAFNAALKAYGSDYEVLDRLGEDRRYGRMRVETPDGVPLMPWQTISIAQDTMDWPKEYYA